MKATAENLKNEIQEEALSKVLPYHRVGVAMSMGIGKTLLALKHMDYNYCKGMKFLVVAPKLSIFKTWEDEANKFGLQHLLPYIQFSTYKSLLKQSIDYNIIYLDECHNLLETHRPYLETYKGRILGLTGTRPRYDKSEKGRMVEQFCPIKYEYKIDDAVDAEILNDYRIIVHRMDLSTDNTLRVETKGRVFYTSERASYDYWTGRLASAISAREVQMMRIMRMKAIMTFPTKEQYIPKLLETIKDKVIIFANTKSQADKLCEFSYHSGNSKSEGNLELFKNDSILRLSCVLQLSEGVNIPNLKEGIVMHSYSNERKLSQRFGRGLRLKIGEQFTLHVLCYRNTVDETWVKQSLEDLDPSKITYI